MCFRLGSSIKFPSLLLTAFLVAGLKANKTEIVTDLCEALYLNQAVSKQQLRRALTRLCLDFETISELKKPESARLLAE